MARIFVNYIATDGRVALWEKHPDHPDGEIFIGGPTVEPVEVEDTAAVRQAIRDDRLVEVRDFKPAAKEKTPKTPKEPKDGGTGTTPTGDPK